MKHRLNIGYLSTVMAATATAQPMATVHRAAFDTADHGWVTQSPSSMAWDSLSQTFQCHMQNFQAEVAYVPVCWNRQSFRLCVDVRVNTAATSAGATIGLFDETFLTGFTGGQAHAAINTDLSSGGCGHPFSLGVHTGSGMVITGNSCGAGSWQENVWYRIELSYNSVTRELRQLVRERASGQLVATVVLTAPGAFRDGAIKYLGVSRRETGGGPGPIADFNIDNVSFQVAPECSPDFNSDGVLNLADFGAFQTWFALGCP